MSIFLPRVGILESRIASGARSAQSAKRKRWTCPQCQLKGVQQRRRVVALDPTHQLYRRPAREGILRGISSRSGEDGVTVVDDRVKQWGGSNNTTQAAPVETNESDELRTSSEPMKDLRSGGDTMLKGWAQPSRVKESFQVEEQERQPVESDEPFKFDTSTDVPDIDYRNTVPKALRTQDPELLLQSLVQAAQDAEYIRSIPGPTFTQILTLLDPEYFIKPFREIHQKISLDTQLWWDAVPLKRILNDYSYTFDKIISARKRTGERLSLTDYKLRLKCAFNVGAHRLAEVIWMDMKHANVLPDTDCYNYRLGALVWNRHFLPESRFRQRVIPHFLQWRRMRTTAGLSEKAVRNHYQASQSYAVGPGGIRKRANNILREMLHSDCIPNEETFVYMIQAYGREGKPESVYQILSNVWNVPETTPPNYTGVKEYPKDDPLYPSQRLLTAIALVFGMNNDVPKAMQLVDHIARGYDLEIPPKVWELFLEWTFVLSKKRTLSSHKKGGTRTGEMRPASVEELWQTMTSPPYNITPTIPMYDFLIKSYISKQEDEHTLSMRDYILEAAPLLPRSRNALLRANLELKEAQELAEQAELPYSLRTLERRVEILELLRRRNYLTMRKWMYLFFKRRAMPMGENMVPELLRELHWCAPTNIKYRIWDVGTIEFKIREVDKFLTDEERFEHYMAVAEEDRETLMEEDEANDPLVEETGRSLID